MHALRTTTLISLPKPRLRSIRSWFAIVLSVTAVVIPLNVLGNVKVVYASGPEVAAMFIKFGHPNYPYEARRARRTGSGIYRVYINPDGTVKTVGVVKSTGHPDLDLAAAAGLYHCLAKPGRRREVDMPVSFTMTRPFY
ncbi:MAG: energy transducer TonB [Chthoniobacterales bacterium]